MNHQTLILNASQFLRDQFGVASHKLPIGNRIKSSHLTQKDKRRSLVVVKFVRGKQLELIKRFLRKEVT